MKGFYNSYISISWHKAAICKKSEKFVILMKLYEIRGEKSIRIKL